MTTTEILALTPGDDLDRAVHNYVFAGIGKQRHYSTMDKDGITLLDRIPGMFVARVDPVHPTFDPGRPWIAGTLAHEPAFKGDVTRLRLAAPTRLIALCKAALIYTLNPAEVKQGESSARPIAKPLPIKPIHNPRPPMPQRKYVKPTELPVTT